MFTSTSRLKFCQWRPNFSKNNNYILTPTIFIGHIFHFHKLDPNKKIFSTTPLNLPVFRKMWNYATEPPLDSDHDDRTLTRVSNNDPPLIGLLSVVDWLPPAQRLFLVKNVPQYKLYYIHDYNKRLGVKSEMWIYNKLYFWEQLVSVPSLIACKFHVVGAHDKKNEILKNFI